jgi:hypothetical protein
MSLQAATRAALSGLAPFASGEHTVHAQHADQRLSCDLTALDVLACAATRLTVESDRLAGRSADELRQIAEQLSKRINYLLEPIGTVETDAERCVVQLRSTPPHKEEDRTSYYELLVSRSEGICLRRYARTTAAQRSVIPAHLTLEVLLRLVGDFSRAAE